MPERIPIFSDQPAHTYTLALDGVHYEFRLVYRDRTASWYLDLYDEQGSALILGRRISPGASQNFGLISNGPPGVLFAFGADPYPRDGLELWYFTADELSAVPVDESGLLPVVIS